MSTCPASMAAKEAVCITGRWADEVKRGTYRQQGGHQADHNINMACKSPARVCRANHMHLTALTFETTTNALLDEASHCPRKTADSGTGLKKKKI